MDSPALLFFVIWSLLLSLYSFGFVEIYVPINSVGLGLLSFNLVASVLLFFHEELHKRTRIKYDLDFQSRVPGWDLKINSLLIIYMCISALDVLYSGGLPIMWVLTNSGRDYSEFGIPTLHGFANGIVFFYITYKFYLRRNNISTSYDYTFLIIAWQIIILSRGVIMVSLAQVFGIYFLTAKSKIGALFKSFVAVNFLIILFGVMGDLRQGSNPYYGLLTNEGADFFEFMPSGYLWVYVYFTSGLNNLFYNIDTLSFNYLPIFSFAKLLPTAFYTYFDLEKNVDNFYFINPGLNVSTIYSGFVSDFGIFAFIPVFAIQALATKYYIKAKNCDIYSVFVYSLFYQCLLLSFFIDTLLYLPFIVQIFFAYYVVGRNAKN